MKNIEIAGHVTTLDALKAILQLNIIICVNVWRGINKFVHRFPWLCIMATVVVAFIICFIQISMARAERDSYNQKNVKLTEKVASYEAAFGEKIE